MDEKIYKIEEALYDLFYGAFRAGEDEVLRRQFELDPPAKGRYADRCIKTARNEVIGLMEDAIKYKVADSLHRARGVKK